MSAGRCGQRRSRSRSTSRTRGYVSSFPSDLVPSGTFRTNAGAPPRAGLLFVLSEVGLAAAQLREQTQDLEVEPDQRDQQAERPVPLHVLRRARRGAVFDEVEIEHQVEGGDDDDDDADADAEPAGAEDRIVQEADLHADDAQNELRDVDDEDRAGGRGDTELEVLGRLE